jgi:phenylpropionate dioxygenase-like ring-hydroxylating dioxygenase large terminal subunit
MPSDSRPNPLDFEIHPDIRRASTLPARCYTDPAIFELERERVFARSHQVAGRQSDVSESGDQLCAEIAGRPIVVVRDGVNLRGFFNVCRHRAGPLALGKCRRQSLSCRYHGWTYGLDGRLLKAPEMDGVADFEPEHVRLTELRVEDFGPLVLASLDAGAPPFAARLGELPARLRELGFEKMRWLLGRNYDLCANWKTYVDNYLEGYHLPHVHPKLSRELDYATYRVEPRGDYSAQLAPLRPASREQSDRRYLPEQGTEQAEYYWIFPNLMLNIYFGVLQTNVVVPLSADRTLVSFDWYAVNPPSDAARDAKWASLVDFSHEIQLEDVVICEAVQRGLASGAYQQGRFSAAREVGVHHFHRLLADSLARA